MKRKKQGLIGLPLQKKPKTARTLIPIVRYLESCTALALMTLILFSCKIFAEYHKCMISGKEREFEKMNNLSKL